MCWLTHEAAEATAAVYYREAGGGCRAAEERRGPRVERACRSGMETCLHWLKRLHHEDARTILSIALLRMIGTRCNRPS